MFRLVRGLLVFAIIMLPVCLLLVAGSGLALFMILAYAAPGLILHHLAPTIPLEEAMLASMAMETVLLSWWLSGANSKGGLAKRGIIAAAIYYLAVFTFILLFIIESAADL
ncbi:MAG: hypothetical protein GSR86_08435 [Desulfurococcales archaeon]|nr:hypothetical protein [Desulfurococcales archaeon]